MITNENKIKNNFINLMISEDQAIGIYQAELIFKRGSKDIFRKFLIDEISHEKELIRIIDAMNWDLTRYQNFLLKINRLFGWFIGFLLSMIPSRLCFVFHRLGEKKAAKDYNDLRNFIDQHDNIPLFESIQVKARLDKIIESEKLHSETFRALLDN